LQPTIKENHTATSCKLLLQDSWQYQGRSHRQLTWIIIAWSTHATAGFITVQITASYNQGLVTVKLGSVSCIFLITIARIKDQLESGICFCILSFTSFPYSALCILYIISSAEWIKCAKFKTLFYSICQVYYTLLSSRTAAG
jgi:hypothetical protein